MPTTDETPSAVAVAKALELIPVPWGFASPLTLSLYRDCVALALDAFAREREVAVWEAAMEIVAVTLKRHSDMNLKLRLIGAMDRARAAAAERDGGDHERA
jgi:hypothetical protein